MTHLSIRLSPDAEGGGAPAEDEMVTIPRAELEELRDAAGRADAPGGGDDPRAEDRLRRVEERFAEELARRDRSAEEREAAYRVVLKERELATALSGQPLVPGAANQLVKLWRDEFEVIDESDRRRVATRDGRSVDEAVGAWLSSPEFAHFRRSTSIGGTAMRGDRRALAPAPPTPSPRNLGEAVLHRWHEAAATTPAPGGPVGLGRRRP